MQFRQSQRDARTLAMRNQIDGGEVEVVQQTPHLPHGVRLRHIGRHHTVADREGLELRRPE